MRLPLMLMGLFLVFATSCGKEDDNNGQENVPVLSTTEVTDITANTATSGGNITDDGGTTVTARGVCWSTNENPTIDDKKTEDGTGTGSFTSIVNDLEPKTTYYLRAYATNSAGTGYASALSFATEEGISGSTFTDPRDSKGYQTVFIGNQEWMAENLAYAPSTGNYWAYDNDDANVETYGYLYDWQTALSVCPTGWHLPRDEEWTELTDYLGGNAGDKLKEIGTTNWNIGNNGATNETGFTALPGGYLNGDGEFDLLGLYGFWWSAAKNYTNYAWPRYMTYYNSNVLRYHHTTEELGFSIRCVRD
jgi:uncharacterized protein (TIGR02145 family)